MISENQNPDKAQISVEIMPLSSQSHSSSAAIKTYRKNSKYDNKINKKKLQSSSSTLNQKFYTNIKFFLTKTFQFLICDKRGKAISILIYLVYMSVSIWNASQIKEGLELADLVADDSYYHTYIKENMRLTDLNPIVMLVVDEPIDYENKNTLMKLSRLYEQALKTDGISKKFTLNWLNSFSSQSLKYKKDLNGFYDSLKLFPPLLNDVIVHKVHYDYHGHEKNRTVLTNIENEIKEASLSSSENFEYQIMASRFYIQYDSLHFSSKDAVPMHLLRDLCLESGLPIFPYSITFKFYEQFEQTLPNVIQSFIISIEAMYLIALLFIPDLVSVFCIIFSMVSIMIGQLGLMHLWGLSLSSITMIELIMSIGFCVDFSAHIVHSFIANSGRGSRSRRAYKACLHVGIPIVNSAVSTIIGVLLLAFCKSYIFISFCKSLLILMSLGVVNSLIFLPVLLSLIGPHWPRHIEMTQNLKNASSSRHNNNNQNDIDSKTINENEVEDAKPGVSTQFE